jgi:hypothetical protein
MTSPSGPAGGRPVHVADGTQATVEVTAIPFAY